MVEDHMTRFARAIAVIVVLAVGTLGGAPPPSSRRANDAVALDRVAIQRLQEEVQIAEILEGLRATPVPALTILRHVRVVDPVDSTVTPGQSIIVSEGQIAWVGASAAEPKVPDATVIDGGDRYASPGLTDMHVHDASASGWLLDLANGVTTVREMGGFPWLLDAREHMKDGRMLGPTLYVAGTIINAFPLEGYAVIVRDAPTARRVVRQLAGCGYDFIKIHNVVPKPAFDAIAEEAARFGMDLVGHVPHGMTNRYAVEHGMRTVEHLKGFLDDRTLEMGDSDYVAVARPSRCERCSPHPPCRTHRHASGRHGPRVLHSPRTMRGAGTRTAKRCGAASRVRWRRLPVSSSSPAPTPPIIRSRSWASH
jgi:hypothetical protein